MCFCIFWLPLIGNMLRKDSQLLVFNRIPKTGSENMAYVIKEMAKINKFNHIRYGNPDHRLISRNNQVNIKYEYQFENTKIVLTFTSKRSIEISKIFSFRQRWCIVWRNNDSEDLLHMIGMCTLLTFKICAGSASHQRGSGISFFIIYNKLIYSFNVCMCYNIIFS